MAMACTSGALAVKAGAVAATRFDSRGKARVSPAAETSRRALRGPVVRPSRKSVRRVAIATAASASRAPRPNVARAAWGGVRASAMLRCAGMRARRERWRHRCSMVLASQMGACSRAVLVWVPGDPAV